MVNYFPIYQDGSITYFKIKHNTQLKKLMMAYSERQAIPLDRLRFMYSGNRLPLDSTPKEVRMPSANNETFLIYGMFIYANYASQSLVA